MCDVLSGVPGCVTKCDRGEGGSKLAKNSVTYFMDGPIFKVMFNFLLQQKKSGGPRCVTYFLGGPGICDKV